MPDRYIHDQRRCNTLLTSSAVAGDPSVQRPLARAVDPPRPRPAGAPGALARRRRRAVRHRPRHDAHGAVADGRRRRAVGRRRRLPARRAGCSSARRPRTSAGARRPGRGTARGGSPSSPRRAARSPSGGRSARTWPTCGWASCGPTRGCARPTSTARPVTTRWPSCAARSTGEDPAELAARLWPLPTLAATAARLSAPARRDASPALADAPPDALPPAITLAAEVVRFLRAEPLLPADADPAAVAARRAARALPRVRPPGRPGAADAFCPRIPAGSGRSPRTTASARADVEAEVLVEAGVVLGVVVDRAERDPVGVVDRRAAVDQLLAAPADRRSAAAARRS